MFMFTSCRWLNFGSHYEHSVSFVFYDKHGNDLFADSLDLRDFSIASINGRGEIAHIDTVEGVTVFNMYLNPDNGKMEAFFHLKDDVDTVSANYTKREEEIKDIIYNGVLLKSKSSIGKLYHIVKE